MPSVITPKNRRCRVGGLGVTHAINNIVACHHPRFFCIDVSTFLLYTLSNYPIPVVQDVMVTGDKIVQRDIEMKAKHYMET